MTSKTAQVVTWRVTGMDCGSCAAKVRGAVSNLPGVSDVDVAMMAERLRLSLDETQTDRGHVEKTVRGLGFGITPANDSLEITDTEPGPSQATPPEDARASSFRLSHKAQMLIATGTLLALAWSARWVFGGDAANASFIIATLLGLFPIVRKAMALVRAGMPFTIEMLMSIAAIGALLIGAASEAALVVFLFALGELLEGLAAGKARDGIRSLAELMPKTARVMNGAEIDLVPAQSLTVGQIVQVRPGDRVPCDGEVIGGASSVDESPITGESMPVAKELGARVFAGSINAQGELRLRVERSGSDNTIARIVRLVEEAESARAPTERFIERFSRWYMPAVVTVAILVACLPVLIAGAPFQTWLYRGLGLLLIGCPCALVISVPASIASGLSTGARHGLLLKGGTVIETAARVTQVAFDKTGTLTHGRPAVCDIWPVERSEEALLRIAAAVETGASHPLAQAILAKAGPLELPETKDAGAIPGQGAFAKIGGESWTVGTPRLAREAGLLTADAESTITRLQDQGKTVVAVFAPGQLAGLLALRDAPRPDGKKTIDDLAAMGIRATMLTGDNARTAAALGGQIGLDFKAELLPEDKVHFVKEMANDAPVMMVGDGINDAPALAMADVGIAMGSGTDVALETADGALMRNHLSDVVALLRLSRATMRNIHQNVAIALGLKLVFLVTTILGLTGLWIAVLADTGATVLVTLNALRLLGFRPGGVSAKTKPAPTRAATS